MKKILLYVDPHPFRNSFMTFEKLGWDMLKSFCDYCPEDYEFRVFSNVFLLDKFLRNGGVPASAFIWPTANESKVIQALAANWDGAAINLRTELVLGRGNITDFYYSILKRIHEEIYEFDGIALWSDNGAVRRFANERNISVCHLELGATRGPLVTTLYMDPFGTNGFASILRAPMEQLEPRLTVSASTWVARQTADDNAENVPGLLDGALTFNPEYTYYGNDYVIAALQLADDLNTLCFSPFRRPADFVKRVCEDFRPTGLKVIVKGHPSSSYTAYSALAQMEAFDVASQYPNSIILEDKLSMRETYSLVSGARSVLSINSSLSFEAALFGKPGFNFGQSYYNLGGAWNYSWVAAVNGERRDQLIDKATSLLLGHYMHPYEVPKISRYICDFFDFQKEVNGLSPERPEYWQNWMDCFDWGYRYLTETPPKPKISDVALSFNKVIEAKAQLKGAIRSSDKLYIDYSLTSAGRTSGITIISGHFFFIVDAIQQEGKEWVILGWCMAKKDKTPPSLLCLVRENKIITTAIPTEPRLDVLEAHEIESPVRFGFKLKTVEFDSGKRDEYGILVFADNHNCQIFQLVTGMQA